MTESKDLALRVETPSSHWSADGKPDPHGNTYDCERAGLCMGNLTDDELANGAFLNYDQPLNVAGILAGTYHPPIAWMTAVKDRIRWLSRSLKKSDSRLHEVAVAYTTAEQERDALAAELRAAWEQDPVATLRNSSGHIGGLHFDNHAPDILEASMKLYARPIPAEPVNQSRPLESIESSELRLELHLRAGPRYQCQSKDCKSYEDGPGKFDTCPGCGRKGYLCGSFVLDKNSTQYQQWVERTREKYRGKNGQQNKSTEAGG